MELKLINYAYKESILNIEINSGTLLGITGTNRKDILELIALKKINKGQIIIDNVKVTKENINRYRRKISYIDQNICSHHQRIIDIMSDSIKRHNLQIKDPLKKIKDSLKIVGLEESLLKRNIITLSVSEKKLLQLAISLLSNPEIIIIDEPFKGLDKEIEKRVVMLFQRLREQFKKTIIISTNDSNQLYKHTTEMLFIKNDQIILSGPTNEVYIRVDFLKRNKFEIPEIVEFTHLAKKKKNVKIDYHKDVRDIIKDIYKHI